MSKYAICSNCGAKIHHGRAIVCDVGFDAVFCSEECFVEYKDGEYLYPHDEEDYDSWFDHDEDRDQLKPEAL